MEETAGDEIKTLPGSLNALTAGVRAPSGPFLHHLLVVAATLLLDGNEPSNLEKNPTKSREGELLGGLLCINRRVHV